MSFRLHKHAPSFFRNVLPGGSGNRFDTQFDAYYVCLMCGLDRRQLGEESLVGDEFVRDYVQSYQPFATLIAGLLVDALVDLEDGPGFRGVVEHVADLTQHAGQGSVGAG